jgi:hypothetical protein
LILLKPCSAGIRQLPGGWKMDIKVRHKGIRGTAQLMWLVVIGAIAGLAA